MSGRLLSLALRLVPRDWRDGIARDLSEEPDAPLRVAARAAAIGVRLRAARTWDALTQPRTPGRIAFMRDFTRDLAFAVRGAVRRPTYSLAVIATLAIGIGATTAIFSVFNWVLLRPIPGAAAPSELVTILFQTNNRQAQFFVSYRDVADLRDGIPALSSLAASTPLALDVAVPGAIDPERMDAEIVTASYFGMFGVTPAPGRDFLPGEERPTATTPPAIISRKLWTRRFDASPAAIGQTLVVNGHAFTIVGVAPASFQGRSLVVSTDVWMPIGAHLQVLPNQGTTLLSDRRNTLFGDAFGRLRPGATPAVAQQQAIAVAGRTAGFARRTQSSRNPVGPIVYAGIGPNVYVRQRLTTIFRLVMGAVSLVLLLACANAANLLLARSLGRRREIAVCQAIGASRFRIVRQQLAEGLVLAGGAGVLGLGLAVLLTALFDGMRLVTILPAVKGVSIDVRVVLFTMVVSLATGLLFAVAPAFASSRVDLNTGLKDGLTASRRGRPLLRNGLTVAQVAISILLLVSAGLFVRTLANIRSLDLGIRADGVVSFSANPPRQGYTDERAHRYFQTVLERLRATRGIASAAYSWTTPYLPMRSENGFTLPGDATVHDAASNSVSRGYFETMGIPIAQGRDFSETESAGGTESSVAIVSRSLARIISPDGHAIGTKLVLDYPKGRQVEVVGIAGDVRGGRLTEDPEPYLYLPATDPVWGVVHVRTSAGLAETVAAIRRVAREIDPAVTPYDIEPLTASVDRLLAEQRLLARLSVVLALVAAILAGVGIYGMMACAVGERMREFGIRLALGARAGRLLALVMRSALVVTAIGMAAGVAGAMAATRVLESRLYGVTRYDPLTVAGACVALMSVALGASAVPAFRAARVDPVKSLRVD
jgi:predicted permease